MKYETYLSIGLRNLSVRMDESNLLHFWLHGPIKNTSSTAWLSKHSISLTSFGSQTSCSDVEPVEGRGKLDTWFNLLVSVHISQHDTRFV